MLCVARSTALPTPGESCVCWAKSADAQMSVASRNRERCFIAMISLVVCLGAPEGEPDRSNVGPDWCKRHVGSMPSKGYFPNLGGKGGLPQAHFFGRSTVGRCSCGRIQSK